MPDDFRRRHLARKHALEIFTRAIQSVEAGQSLRKHLRIEKNRLFLKSRGFPLSRFRRCIAVGAGKACAAMGKALEEILGERLDTGHLTVKYGHVHPLKRIRLTEAGHPLPDNQGVIGTAAVLDLLQSAGTDDLVIALFSGGGSALLPLPLEGISLEDKQKTVSALLNCGASIHEINTLRKHLSGIKGGRLAQAAYPARLFALVLSDVVGDDLDVIASGPTVPDPSTFVDCLDIVSRYALTDVLPSSVMALLKKGVSGTIPESPKPGDPIFKKTETLVIGSNIQALSAARDAARRLGYHPLILSSIFQGSTREAARFHASIAEEIRRSANPVPRPACLISGGETTVVVTGKGTGGRNQEFVLEAALQLAGRGPVVVLSAGTDGTDGPTDAAGALADDITVSRARAAGKDPLKHLEENDAYPFFKSLDDLVITGPTDTNVMDLRILIVP